MAAIVPHRVPRPDGKTHIIYGPDNATPEQLQSKLNSILAAERQDQLAKSNVGSEEKQQIDLADVPGKALQNLAPSAVNFAKDVYRPFYDPIGTAKGVKDLAVGVGSKLGLGDQSPDKKAENEQAADAVGQYLKDRFYGWDNIKNTLATDPVGSAADVASLLTLGGGLAARAPQYLGRVGTITRKVGDTARKVGDKIDPTRIATAPLSPVVTSASNAVDGVRNYLSGPPDDLGNMGRAAAKRMYEAYKMSGENPQALRQRAQELGPRGMLLDLDRTFTDVAEGINQQPGAGRNLISGALEKRSEGATDALTDAIDRNIGKPINVPRTVEEISKRTADALAPHYARFHRSSINLTPDLERIINLVKEVRPKLLNDAVDLARLDGIEPRYLSTLSPDVMGPMTGVQTTKRTKVWTGAELDYLRRAIAKLGNELSDKGDAFGPKYRLLAGSLNTAIDTALNPRNPSQSLYARLRAVSGEGLGLGRSMEEGQGIFRRDRTADQLEMDQEMRGMTEKAAFQAGARDSLRATMDNAASSVGPRGDINVATTLNSKASQDKLRHIIGPDKTDDLSRTLQGEIDMRLNTNQIMGGSPTARREAIKPLVPLQYQGAYFNKIREMSPTGAVAEGVIRLANFLTLNKINSRNSRIATDMARSLISQGTDMNLVINGLEAMKQQEKMSRQKSQYIDSVIQKIRKYGNQPLYQTGRIQGVLQGSQQGLMLDENDQPIR